MLVVFFFFSSRRRHTRCYRDWSSDVCSSDLSCPSTSCRLRRPYAQGERVRDASTPNGRETRPRSRPPLRNPFRPAGGALSDVRATLGPSPAPPPPPRPIFT